MRGWKNDGTWKSSSGKQCNAGERRTSEPKCAALKYFAAQNCPFCNFFTLWNIAQIFLPTEYLK